MAVAQVGASKTATPLPDDKKKPEASNRNQPTTAKKIDASAGNTSTTKKYTPQSSKALDASASNTVLAKVDPKVDPKADPKSEKKSDPKSETKSTTKPLDLEADTKGLDTKKVATSKADATGVKDLTAGAEGVSKSQTKGDPKSETKSVSKPLDLEADTKGLDTKKVATSKVDATGVKDLTAGAEGVSKSQTKGDPKSETKSTTKPLDLEADTKGLDTKKVATSKADATGVKDLTAGAEGVSKSQTKGDPKSETKSTTKPLDLEADTKGLDTKKVATSKVDATGVEDLTAGAEGVSKSQTKSDPKSETKSTTKPLDLEADTKGVDTKKVATSKVDATGVKDLTAGAEGVPKSQTKSDPKSETKSTTKPLDLEADTKGVDTKKVATSKVDATGVEDLTAGAEGVSKSQTKSDPKSETKSTTKPLDLEADTKGVDTKKVATSKVDATGVEDLTAGAEGVPKSVTKTLDPNSTDTAGLSEADLARVGVDTTKLGDLKSDLTGTDLNQETEVRDGTTKPLDLDADTKVLDTKKVDATGVEDLTAGAEGVPKSVTKTLDPNSTDTAGLSEADLARVGVDTTKLGDLKSDLTGTDLNQETEVRDGTTKPLDLEADTKGLDTKKVDATGVEDLTAGAEGVPKSVTKTLDPNSTDTAGLSEADLARVGVDTTKLGDLKSDLTGTDLNQETEVRDGTTKPLDLDADTTGLDTKKVDATGVEDMTAGAEGVPKSVTKTLDPNSTDTAGLSEADLARVGVDTTKLGDLKSDLTGTDLNQETEVRDGTTKPLDLDADTTGLDTKKVDATGVEDLTAGAEGVPKSVTKTLDPNSTDTAGLSEADLARVGVDTTKLGDLKSDLTGTDLNQETEVRDGTTKPLDLDADTTGLDTKKVDATGVEDMTAGAEGVPKSVTKTLDPNSTDTTGLDAKQLASLRADATGLGDTKGDPDADPTADPTGESSSITKTLDLDKALQEGNITEAMLAESKAADGSWNPTSELADRIFNSSYMSDVNSSLYQALKGTDKSFMSKDILSNPGAYDDKQRMIAYLDVLSAQGAYTRFKDGLEGEGRFTNNSQEIMKDLANAESILKTDQGAQSKLTENIFKRIQGGFGGAVVGHQYDESKSYEENMEAVLQENNRASELRESLTASYQKDIVEGGLLKAGREAGADYKTVFEQYNSALGVYNSVLTEDYTKQHIDATNASYSKFFADDFLNNLPDTKEALDGLFNASKAPEDPKDRQVDSDAARQKRMEDVIKQPLTALSETYFKDNAEAQKTYSANVTTVMTAAWQLAKPGGNFDQLKTQLGGFIDENIKTSAGGMEQAKYKDTLLSGITGIMQGARAVWSGVNMKEPTGDAVSTVLLHSMAGTSQFLKSAGSTVENSSKFLGDLAGVYDKEFLSAEKKATASALKGVGSAIGNIAAVGWLPVDYYQLFKGVQDGSLDTTGTVLAALGTAGDTVGGVEGIAGLSQALINSNFVRGAGVATRLLPAAFSTVFTGAAVVSWAGWAGLQIYNDVRQWKEWSGQKDAVNEQLYRTVGDTMNVYASDPPAPGRLPTFPTPVEETETTPEDWGAIRDANVKWRNENGFSDWQTPTIT